MYFYPRSPCGERPCGFSSLLNLRFHFYPRSPCGERLFQISINGMQFTFLSTLSLRRATWWHTRRCGGYPDFYPRSPCGERHNHGLKSTHNLDFYPRSPCGERRDPAFHLLAAQEFLSTLSLRRATYIFQCLNKKRVYFYPRSPCGERLNEWKRLDENKRFLSTLSLRRATIARCLQGWYKPISIHALLAESDAEGDPGRYPVPEFLSTLSLRRATPGGVSGGQQHGQFLSTLSLRRATTELCVGVLNFPNFYPRSPCGERRVMPWFRLATNYFYPRSPCGERLFAPTFIQFILYFYPRSPCGERLSNDLVRLAVIEFLSTLSLRRATSKSREFAIPSASISIHALLAESDLTDAYRLVCQQQFLSTLSLRRATFDHFACRFVSCYFYPRSPCGERLPVIGYMASFEYLFLSTLSLRRATIYVSECLRMISISIHALLAESDVHDR